MTIVATCECGKQYRVRDELAGQRRKCRACGGFLLVEEQPPDEPEEATEDAEDEEEHHERPRPKRRKGKHRRPARSSWAEVSIVGIWLFILLGLGVVVAMGVIFVPRIVSNMKPAAYYTEQDNGDHLLVTIHRTKVGSIPVEIKKSPTRVSFDRDGNRVGASRYELPNTAQYGGTTTSKEGISVTYEVQCTREAGVTQVICDGKPVRKSAW